MMHPDQIYTVRQLRHDDLQAEAQQARMTRELLDNRPSWGFGLAAWLRRLSVRRGAIPTSQAGSSVSSRTS